MSLALQIKEKLLDEYYYRFMMPAISNSGVYRYVVLVDDGGM